MDNRNANEVQELISAVDETVREYDPFYTQSEGWDQSIQALDGIERMLTQARSHYAISAATYAEKAEQIASLINLLKAIMIQRYVPVPLALIHPTLSAREVEVLKWSAAGKTASDIGVILSLKERTIHFHMSNAVKKMGVSNKTAAVAQAMMCGVL
jgi:LuxR family transcriptional regulator